MTIGVDDPGLLTVALGVLIFRELAEIVGELPLTLAILTIFLFLVKILRVPFEKNYKSTTEI